MASRSDRKAAARARRQEAERAQARSARWRRLGILGATVVAAILAVVGLVLVSNGGGRPSAPPRAGNPSTTTAVEALLRGIPQEGARLGRARAPVTLEEYADLECPYCREFTLGAEDELIAHDVRSGAVKLRYHSVATATAGGPDPHVFAVQQAAALAAGAQHRAWNYIETFYREQGQEGTGYVTGAYLTALARQVPGLDLAVWRRALANPAYAAEILAGERTATHLGIRSTPTFVAIGPHRETRPTSTLSYATLESMIRAVR